MFTNKCSSQNNYTDYKMFIYKIIILIKLTESQGGATRIEQS